MNERTKAHAGTALAAVLATDGALHAYWATGRCWPVRDAQTLAHVILNSDDASITRPSVVGPIAGLLFLGAMTAQARVHRLGRLGRHIPDSALQAGTLAIATGLLARGVMGIRMARGGDTGTTFYKVNRLIYTPACLMLCAAAVIAARSESVPVVRRTPEIRSTRD